MLRRMSKADTLPAFLQRQPAEAAPTPPLARGSKKDGKSHLFCSWRRRKDSNLRGDFSPNILAGCCLQPLGHASMKALIVYAKKLHFSITVPGVGIGQNSATRNFLRTLGSQYSPTRGTGRGSPTPSAVRIPPEYLAMKIPIARIGIFIAGARGGIRTHKPFRVRDFKSPA